MHLNPVMNHCQFDGLFTYTSPVSALLTLTINNKWNKMAIVDIVMHEISLLLKDKVEKFRLRAVIALAFYTEVVTKWANVFSARISHQQC